MPRIHAIPSPRFLCSSRSPPRAGKEDPSRADAVTRAQLKDVSRLEGQIVQINSVLVRHADTAQVFTFGDKQGPEIHVGNANEIDPGI
jgi:hypothetical protein